MAIDASIYQNAQAPQMPSVADSMQKALTLSNLGMQNQQQQYQMQTQQAMRQAYQNNVGPDGQINRQGLISDIGRVNPKAAIEMGQQFNAMDKSQADKQSAQMAALHSQASVAAPAYGYLLKLPDDQAAEAYPKMIHQMSQQGVDISNLPPTWDRAKIQQGYNVASQYKEQMDNALTATSATEKQAQTQKDLAEADKLRSETYKRNPDILGQNEDPARLVPGYVPKEHQAQALSEIDAAENTKRMSKSIMSSFDQAANENTVLKTGFGIVRTPGSVMALHQALQPTFKDLEGTVRQAAMDNTFRNITPAPGDSAATIATKRRALEGYLQSKASAPTARAYGIDLNRFDSTSAYKSTPTKGSDGGASSGGNSAYAASLPSASAGGFSLSEIRAELARRKAAK